MSRILIFAVAVLAVGAKPNLRAQEISGMPSFKEVLSLKSVGSPQISPDGRMVAYTVRSTDWDENSYDTEIWLAPGDGEVFQLTRTRDGSSTSPQWSPDGRRIAFAADRGEGRQLHLIAIRGGEATPITKMDGGVGAFSWAPAGDRILLLVSESESEESKATKEEYGAFEVEDAEARNSHLWIIEIDKSGGASEPERLTEGDFHISEAHWSPDGTKIAYVGQPDSKLLSFMESDIYVLDVESRESSGLVEGPGPDGGLEWSPDGEWILFNEYEQDLGSFYFLNSELARVPLAGGDIQVLTRDFDEDPGPVAWTEAGIRFGAGDRTRRIIYTLDPETGVIEELPLPSPIVGSWTFTPDGSCMAFIGQGGGSLGEVFRAWGAESGTPQYAKLTDMTAQTEGWKTGTREVVSWQSEDGAVIEGVLYKPADWDPSRRYPLLVNIHGGPTSTSRPTMVPTRVYPILHWLAKGAVVLEPNYRGSAGYGEAFRSLNVRNLGVGDMWDVMSGVQYLIDAGIADPDRMGSMGWSQGGYISAFLTTNTNVFQAISVGAGISNWMTYYVNTDIHPFTRQYLKGTPWDDPEIYATTSPMTNINRASTPTLIQHGEFDRRVPIPNAYELYQGLQDVGVETRLIVYKGFGHGINKPKELLAAVWHNWQWFGKHIWGEEIELPIELKGEKDAGGP